MRASSVLIIYISHLIGPFLSTQVFVTSVKAVQRDRPDNPRGPRLKMWPNILKNHTRIQTYFISLSATKTAKVMYFHAIN